MNTILTDRLQAFHQQTNSIRAYRGVLLSQKTKAEADEETHKYKSELHQKCMEIFKKWLEDSLNQNVNSIAELATTGLRHVIHDQALTFKIQQDPQKNKLSMNFVLEQDGVEGNPLHSFGGGAAVIISLVMRMAVMARMKMSNLLLLDESMLAISNVYIPAAADFMRQLSEQTGVNILMVTHSHGFMEAAHTMYEGSNTAGSFKVRKIPNNSSLP